MNDLCDIGLKSGLLEWALWMAIVAASLFYKHARLKNLHRDCQCKELTIEALMLRERQLREEISDLVSFVDDEELDTYWDDYDAWNQWNAWWEGGEEEDGPVAKLPD